jgi:hypothetical protein
VTRVEISQEWLGRLRAGRVSWVPHEGASGAQRGDQVTLVVPGKNREPEAQITAEVTDATLITTWATLITTWSDDQARRELVVVTVISVKLLG